MAKVTKLEDGSGIINVGSNFRIEAGPALMSGVASPELLANSATAPHYAVGLRDARGRPIKEGAEFAYLDYGGEGEGAAEGNNVFYVYEKQPVNSTDEFINDEVNPNFVPQHVRDAAVAGERGEDRVFYDYRWVEVAAKKTEDAAIEYAQRKAAE